MRNLHALPNSPIREARGAQKPLPTRLPISSRARNPQPRKNLAGAKKIHTDTLLFVTHRRQETRPMRHKTSAGLRNPRQPGTLERLQKIHTHTPPTRRPLSTGPNPVYHQKDTILRGDIS
jgi:hypothetical protein